MVAVFVVVVVVVLAFVGGVAVTGATGIVFVRVLPSVNGGGVGVASDVTCCRTRPRTIVVTVRIMQIVFIVTVTCCLLFV